MKQNLSSLLFIIPFLSIISAVWLPKDPLNLGKYFPASGSGMTACHLRDTLYVSAYVHPDTALVTHFTWTESGQKSELKSFVPGTIQSLLCLKNGQYLIVTYRDMDYDNFTFGFFAEDGSLSKSFVFNDTMNLVLNIRVREMPNGNLLITPKQPTDVSTFIAPILILDRNGNVIERKELNFNIPPTASQHNTPISWTYLKSAVNEDSKIILAAYNTDWEMDLSLSSTAYFPTRTYFNLSILDSNLTMIMGPSKFYAPRVNNEFDIILMGNDRFAFIAADRATYGLNLTIYNMNLEKISSDYINIQNNVSLFARPVGTSQQGIVVIGIGPKNIFWQSYHFNGTKKGDLVALGEDFKVVSFVQLKSGDDFGILYMKNEEIYFSKGEKFNNYANSASLFRVSLFLVTVFIFTLL